MIMQIFPYIIITSIAGFLMHQLRRITEVMFRRGWRDLIHYAIGIVGTLPFARWVFRKIHQLVFDEYRERLFCLMRDELATPEQIAKEKPLIAWHAIFSLSYALTFLAVGVGVVVGWIIDTVIDNKKHLNNRKVIQKK